MVTPKKTEKQKLKDFEKMIVEVSKGNLKTKPSDWSKLTDEQKARYTAARKKVDPYWRNPDEAKKGWPRDKKPPPVTPETRKRSGPICGAKTTGKSSSGEGICCMPAGAGTDHKGRGACWRHAGTMPSHLVKDIKEIAMQKMVIYGKPKDIDPDHAILEELARTAGHVDWLRDRIQALEDPEQLKSVTAFGVGPNFWLKLYQSERDHLTNVAKVAKAMGIAERQVRIAEEQGRMIAMAMMKFMDHPLLNMTPEQKALARTAAREVLLSIEVESRELPVAKPPAS